MANGLTLDGDDTFNFLQGSANDDRLRGFGNDDWLTPFAGNDTLDGGSGFDLVFYEDQPNGVIINNSAVTRFGVAAHTTNKRGQGTDVLISVENFHGSAYGDIIIFGTSGGYVFDRGGDDFVEAYQVAGGSGLSFQVGSGNDRYVGSPNSDDELNFESDIYDGAGAINCGVSVTFSGGGSGTARDGWGFTDTFSGIERIRGTSFNDTITGDDTDNRFRGFAGNDRLTGGSGDRDRLDGGAGNDTLDGGAGDRDQVEYQRDKDQGGTAGVTVDLQAGTATDGFGSHDVLIGIERVRGTDVADTLRGDSANNDLLGGSGDDLLEGRSGYDYFEGGAGRDTIDGGVDNDQVSYFYDWEDGGTNGVSVNLATGGAQDGFGNFDKLISIEDVQGTDKDDSLYGNAARNYLRGEGGNDLLNGGAEDDDLEGGSGNDTLIGGAGNDYLEGGDGDDRLDASADLTGYGDFIRPGLGSNTIIGSAALYNAQGDGIDLSYTDVSGVGGLTISVGANGSGTVRSGNARLVNDTFTFAHYFIASGDNDTLKGSDADHFEGWAGMAGNDTFDGGDGFDRLSYRDEQYDDAAFRGVVVNFATGKATDAFGNSDTFVNMESVEGTWWDDRFVGSDALEYIVYRGLDGADTIAGSAAGFDIADYSNDANQGGGAGIDANLLLGTIIDGFGKTDTVANLEQVRGTSNRDRIALDGTGQEALGEDGDDTLAGGTGDDSLDGGADNDSITGGAGDDVLQGGEGDDTLTGDGGADQIYGNAGNDVLDGSFANDQLFGGSGDDTLRGGTGNDELYGNAGADRMDGEDNSDVYIIDGSDVVTDSGTSGYDKAQINDAAGVAVTLTGWSGVERVNGFTGADVIDASTQTSAILLSGDSGNDHLTGGSADDVLIGGAGSDTLVGGNGRDIMLGNSGNDVFDGGAGDDIFLIDDAGDFVRDGGADFDKAVIAVTTGLAINIGSWVGVERINGLTGNDAINATGMATAITLVGASGNDTLTGGSGGDTFFGGSGDDLMSGAGGDDALIGSSGNDTMEGGAGNDFYLGGAGADSFAFVAGFGRDIVKDYTDGTDRLDFSGHAGVNSLTDLVITQSGANTSMSLAIGGVDQIVLIGVTATDLTATDFDFV